MKQGVLHLAGAKRKTGWRNEKAIRATIDFMYGFRLQRTPIKIQS